MARSPGRMSLKMRKTFILSWSCVRVGGFWTVSRRVLSQRRGWLSSSGPFCGLWLSAMRRASSSGMSSQTTSCSSPKPRTALFGQQTSDFRSGQFDIPDAFSITCKEHLSKLRPDHHCKNASHSLTVRFGLVSLQEVLFRAP